MTKRIGGPDRAVYDDHVSSLGGRLRAHVSMFFTNWRNPNYGLAAKIGLTFKNRAKSLFNGGCCGNHGQPGC
jgi:hypothetical protein